MADALLPVITGQMKKLKDMADGTYAEVIYVANPGGGSSGGSGTTGAALDATLSSFATANHADLGTLTAKLPNQVSGRVPVDGSGVTQPVSLTALPALAAGTAAIGTVSVSNFPATQATAEQNVRAGEDLAADTQHISDDGVPTYISTAATTLVASGRGVLKRIVLSETAAGTITVYDSLTATGTVIAAFKASVAEQTFECGFQFANGLTILTAAASKLTVVTGL